MKMKIVSIVLTFALIIGFSPLMPINTIFAQDDGLLLWYKFDENGGNAVLDYSGKNHNGTLSGGYTRTTAPDGSGALELNGSNGYIAIPNGIMSDITDVTISTKVYVDNSNVDAAWIWTFGSSTDAGSAEGTKYLGLFEDSSKNFRASITTNRWTGEQNVSKKTSLGRGRWKNIVYTLCGNSAVLYEDGVKIDENTNVTNKPSDIEKTIANYIGRPAYSGDKYFKGKISDFRIYNRALDGSEIKTLSYNMLNSIVEEDKKVLDLGDTNKITKDINLPTMGSNGSTISWLSSDEKVISSNGTVSRPVNSDGNKTVTLTAKISNGEISDMKVFTVTVIALQPGEDIPQDPEPEVEYPLISDVNDVGGNGYNGSIVGNVTFNSDGLTLPGGSGYSTNYVKLPGKVYEGQDNLTVSAWIKSSNGSKYGAALSFAKTDNTHYWMLNPNSPSGVFNALFKDDTDGEIGVRAGATTMYEGKWTHYTTVITPNSVTGYINGIKIGTTTKKGTVSQFGTGLDAYIGISNWPDDAYAGSLQDLRIYYKALNDSQVSSIYNNDVPDIVASAKTIETLEKAKEALNIGYTGAVTHNLNLPTSGSFGETISWASSLESALSTSGIVNVTDKPQTVTLTATISLNGAQVTKEFTVNLIPVSDVVNIKADQLYIPYRLYQGNSIPMSIDGATVSWSSSNPSIVDSTGLINPPTSGSEDVKLTATVSYDGSTVTREFNVKVMPNTTSYIAAYTRSGSGTATAVTNALHLGYSNDGGKEFTALNNNTGVLFPLCDFSTDTVNGTTKVMNSPYIFRMQDGTFGVVAKRSNTDGTQTTNEKSAVLFFTSKDLVTYKEIGMLSLKTDLTVNSPICEFDTSTNEYRIEWTSIDGTIHYNTTSDFVTLSEPKLEPAYKIVKTIANTDISAAVPSNSIAVTDDEEKVITDKLGKVENTNVSNAVVTVAKGESYTFNDLAKVKVTASYSDGSTADKPVQWNMDDFNKIDFSKAGIYTVNGTVIQEPAFPSNWISGRADPDIYLYKGKYYFVATNESGQNTIGIREADTISGLKDAEEHTIIKAASAGEFMSYYLWAPELHEVNGKLYIFMAGGVGKHAGSSWGVQSCVIPLKDGGNPLNKDDWGDPMRVVRKDGSELDSIGITLDMTSFMVNNESYVAWSQRENWGATKIMIAKNDPNQPWKLTTDPVQISISDYGWDRQTAIVNEGPQVLEKNGKTYMAFSASGTDATYCLGMLTADNDSDLLDPASWRKTGYPVLTSGSVPGYYGPGHNSFVVDEYGTVMNIFISKQSSNGGRNASARIVHFGADGAPIFDMIPEREILPKNKNVAVTLNIGGTDSVSPKVEISKNNDNLIAKLIKEDGSEFTTDAAVKYEWYRDDKLIEGKNSAEYNLSDDDKGKKINVKIEQYNLTSDYIFIDDDTQDKDDSIKITYKDIPDGAYDFSKQVKEGLDAVNVNNDTKEEEILAAVKPYIETTTGPEVNVSIEDYDLIKSTNDSEGSIVGTLVVNCDDYTSKYGFYMEISKLDTDPNDGEDFTTEVNKAIELIKADNNTTSDDIVDEVKPYVQATTGSAVEVSIKDYNLNKATYSNSGNITGTIIIKCDGHSSEYGFDLKIAMLESTVDKSKLKALYDTYKNVSQGSYTNYTWSIFVAAINNAETQLEKEDATEAEVSNAYNDLKAAIQGLKTESSSSSGSHHSNITTTSNDTTQDTSNQAVSNNISEKNSKTGWKFINGKWYMFDKTTGKIITGWYNDKGIWYYLGNDGVMSTGWFLDKDGKWYCLNESGAMQIGWFKDTNGDWYHLTESGAMQIGWFEDDNGNWYYLKQNGVMAHDEDIDGYYVGSDGAWIKSI